MLNMNTVSCNNHVSSWVETKFRTIEHVVLPAFGNSIENDKN